MAERLRELPDLPNYLISSTGVVYYRRKGTKDYRPLKAFLRGGHSRYPAVQVFAPDGRRQTVTVHSLVLRAFVGPRPVGQQCRHADGNRLNSQADNLSYGTAKDNAGDRRRHGRTTAKLTEANVRAARQEYVRGGNVSSMARVFGVSGRTLREALTGRTFGWVPGAVTLTGRRPHRKRPKRGDGPGGATPATTG